MKKAEFIGKRWSTYEEAIILEYKYRGVNYEVKTGWNCEPESWQHKSNQDFIDRVLDTKILTTEDAQAGLDLFFETTE